MNKVDLNQMIVTKKKKFKRMGCDQKIVKVGKNIHFLKYYTKRLFSKYKNRHCATKKYVILQYQL